MSRFFFSDSSRLHARQAIGSPIPSLAASASILRWRTKHPPAGRFTLHILIIYERYFMIAVLFEANALPEAQSRYLQLASELKPLLSEIPGFISVERFQSLDGSGKILSLSWWEDEDSLSKWKQNTLHQAAQREGKQAIFSWYRIRIAHVFRDYSSETRDRHHV